MTSFTPYKSVESLKYYMTIRIGSYERPSPFDKGEFKTENIIKLPLPLELRDDTSVSYSNESLQLSGDILNGSIGSGVMSQALRRSGDVLSNGISGTLGGLANMLPMGLSGIADTVADEAKAAFPADQVTSAIQQKFGIAPNPNPSVAFQGPVLRDFNFSWTFTPTNKADSLKIRNIINLLKRSALPSNKISGSAAILDYPKMVQVNFYPWDSQSSDKHGWTSRSIIKMKKCFMSSVNANFTPSNTPAFFHDTNEPVATSLSISMREIEYFLSSDYDGKNGSGTEQGIIEELKSGLEGFGNQLTSVVDTSNPIANATG